MFAAVYLGGPRWRDPERDLSTVDRTRLIREMEWYIRWITRTNPSGDRIVEWMREVADPHTALPQFLPLPQGAFLLTWCYGPICTCLLRLHLRPAGPLRATNGGALDASCHRCHRGRRGCGHPALGAKHNLSPL